jgi:hypothetical protein
MKRIYLGGCLLLLVAGVRTPAGLSSTKLPATSPCLANQLSVSRVSDDAGVGNRAVNFAFTNTSPTPCTLSGYPGFTPLDRRGRPMRGVRVTQSDATYFQPEQPAQEVTLEPGKTAWFQIAYTAVQSTPRKCPSSVKVKITAPGTKRVFLLREEITPCQHTVTVTPVRSGLPE